MRNIFTSIDDVFTSLLCSMATGERRLVTDDRGNKTPGGIRGGGEGSLPTEGTTLEGKHEYCTTKTQTVLHDGGARTTIWLTKSHGL